MPDLPEIVPNSAAVQVPATVGVQRLDIDRPNPAIRAVQEQGQTIENQAGYIAATIQRQRIANQAMQVDSSYINKTADLEKSVAGIADPQQKLAAIQQGTKTNIASILAENPDVAPHIKGQLAVREAETMRNANLQFVADSHAQAKEAIAGNYKDSLIAIANAPTAQDGQVIKNNFNQYLQHTAENGFFNKGEATATGAKFNYDVSKTLFEKLGRENPQQALAMPLAQTGLLPKDYRAAQDDVYKDFKFAKSTADLQRQKDVIQYTREFISSKTSPGQDEEAWKHKILSTADYQWKYGKQPTDSESEGIMHNLVGAMDSFDGGPDDFKKWSIANVTENTNLKGDARAAAGQYATLRFNELNTDMGRSAQQYKYMMNDYFHRTFKNLFNSNVVSGIFKSKILQGNSSIANSFQMMMKAKSTVEQQKYYDQAIKTLNSIGGSTIPEESPAPSAEPAGVPAVSLPVAPKDESPVGPAAALQRKAEAK